MAIEINVETEKEESKKEEGSTLSFEMNARRSLDGNIMIFDHIDIDIVYAPGTKKVLTFAKQMQSDTVYAAQNRMFDYLMRHGVVIPESIRGGNVYGSMEAQVPEPAGDLDATKVVIMSIGKFLEEEKPYFMYEKAYKENEVEDLVDPDAEDSTDLGEVPQAAKKGSIGQLRGYWNV
tara:strand:+ start:496 stop:1026 length:531 start_codon:yes stop_codon:yes gene_type:complete